MPDITSMIDVVFLLIIFFLTTSSLIQMTRIPLDLPEETGESVEEQDSSGLVVNIESDGRIVVDQAEVSIDRLVEMIRLEIEESGGLDGVDVLLRADQSASLLHVNAVAEALIDLGVRSWRLATRTPRPSGGAG